MENEVSVFQNKEFGEIRSIMIDGEPWFVGKDVAGALGYVNTRDALYKRVDKEDKDVAKHDSLGGKQKMTIINESGLYSLILGSKLPSAKKFKRWVTSEVLPAIRKTGKYSVNKQTEIDAQNEMMLAVAETLKGVVETMAEMQKSIAIVKEKVEQRPEIHTTTDAASQILKPANRKQIYKEWRTNAYRKVNLIADYYKRESMEVLHDVYKIVDSKCKHRIGYYKAIYLESECKEDCPTLEVIYQVDELCGMFAWIVNQLVDEIEIPS